MALSIADPSGSPSCPFFLMPDLKNAPPVRQSLFHRLGLRKWLARDGHSSDAPPKFDCRDVRPDPQNVNDHNNDIIGDSGDTNCDDPFQSRRRTANIDIGLPRPPTFKRQNSERREQLTPFEPGHRRAVSADRRRDIGTRREKSPLPLPAPRLSAPALRWEDDPPDSSPDLGAECLVDPFYTTPYTEVSSEYGEEAVDVLEKELDRKWILNLSMRFRDKSDREKFFVTYAEAPNRWRKVTISCDYRDAEPESLEDDLKQLYYHRDKNAQIYESIRDSIAEIQFYDTVTNLRLETRDSRLHVHVTEDVNEIIPYPSLSSVDYLDPLFVPESQLTFESHLSGFVYRVRYEGNDYVKKEITGPDTIEEFLYEINALHALLGSESVIKFKGIIVDDTRTVVKGLLIELAEKGALADLFYDCKGALSWARREGWAKQVIRGLADIHEAGFVQGDFTVSNVVVDENDDAKLIDINRRGCPIGWEPPEFTKKLENKQRISMYIGVKSDLYQLGMTLWAIAMEEDEPGRQPRPLVIPVDMKVPDFYRDIVDICLSEKPQDRRSAKELLALFPEDDPVPLSNVADVNLQYSKNGSINMPPGYCPIDINLDQVDPGSMEQYADNIQFASLPNSFTSLEDSFRHHQPIVPVLLSPSGSSPELGCMDSNPRNAEHENEYTPDKIASLPEDCHFSLEAESPRQHTTNSFFTPGDVQFPVLDQINATSAVSNVAILDGQATEAGLDITPGRLSSQGPGQDSGYAYSTGICRASQILSCVGTNPSCFLNGHYLEAGENITSSDNHSVSDILCQLHTEQADVDNGSFQVAKSHSRPYEANFISEPPQMDLFLSRLPINPAFISLENIEAAFPCKGSNCDSNSQPMIPLSQMEMPFSFNDDIFTSMLPLNPRFCEMSQRQAERYTLDTDYLLTSKLPINPAFVTAFTEISDQVERYTTDTDNLLSSNLPINPAFRTSFIQISDQVERYTPDTNDLFSSRLPVNPAFITAFTQGSDLKIPVTCQSSSARVIGLKQPINSCSDGESKLGIGGRTSDFNNLLTSRLPINPAFKSTWTSRPEYTASVYSPPSYIQNPATFSSPAIPYLDQYNVQRRTPDLINDLYASKLPINPASIADISVPGITGKMLGNNPSFEAIKLGTAQPRDTELILSRLPINPAISA